MKAKKAAPITSPYGRLFAYAEAAEYLGLSYYQVRRLVATRKIRALHGVQTRIYERWCDEFIERNSTLVGETEKERRRRTRERQADEPMRPIGIAGLPGIDMFP
jgi:excisionase family DNA binding protein